MDNSKDSKTGLTLKDKILIFFFGVLFVMFVGYQYLYNLPGTEKQKRQGIILYYAGILFWVLVVVIIFCFS